ncbi:MAG TPA: PLD nuclease N-terminal domain-containing protein [Kribbella sp.]
MAESVLKAVALADLARRPADQVRGPKPLWAVFLTVFNSVGAGPVLYWLFGRRKTS